jgi:hypothetical protein
MHGKKGNRSSEQHRVGREDQGSQESSIVANGLFKKAVLFGGL